MDSVSNTAKDSTAEVEDRETGQDVTRKVQCADCFAWIDRDASHTCRQQVRRNRARAAKGFSR